MYILFVHPIFFAFSKLQSLKNLVIENVRKCQWNWGGEKSTKLFQVVKNTLVTSTTVWGKKGSVRCDLWLSYNAQNTGTLTVLLGCYVYFYAGIGHYYLSADLSILQYKKIRRDIYCWVPLNVPETFLIFWSI